MEVLLVSYQLYSSCGQDVMLMCGKGTGPGIGPRH